VDPRAALNDVEKRKFLTLPGLELRPLDHPARSQLPYRPQKSQFRIAGILTEFQTKQLPDISLEHYFYTNLFGLCRSGQNTCSHHVCQSCEENGYNEREHKKPLE
jgi:hypothetical protein